MRFIQIVIFVSAVILNAFRKSSCTPPKERDFLSRVEIPKESTNAKELGSQFMRVPNSGPLTGINIHSHPSSILSSSDRNLSLDLSLPPEMPSSSKRSIFPAEPLLRERSRSPRAKYSNPVKYCNAVIGCLNTPEELNSIRLIPIKNSKTLFKICKFTFPPDKPIHLRGERKALVPLPTEERKVLTTLIGDVLAIFENNNTRLRGMYMMNGGSASRAKINMYTGKVTPLDPKEMKETPLDPSMGNNFKMVRHSEAHI